MLFSNFKACIISSGKGHYPFSFPFVCTTIKRLKKFDELVIMVVFLLFLRISTFGRKTDVENVSESE